MSVAAWTRLGNDLERQPRTPATPYAAVVELAVLGPVEVRLDGRAVDLGTPKQRSLVAALALSRGRPVSVDSIVDLLWGDHAPPGVTATLQAYVSGLRRVLEPQRERRAPASVLVTVAPGYALRVPADASDATAFEETVNQAHRRLQALTAPDQDGLSGEDLREAVSRLEAVLALWRGTPYGELDDAPSAVAERARLEELRMVALEDHAVAELALGNHGTVAAELEALTAVHPLRERLWALRALALTRSGRQAEALDVLRRVREVLDDELGLEPGAELRDLQTAVLRQDPSLDWVAPRSAPVAQAPVPAEAPPSTSAADVTGGWPMVGRDVDLARLVDALGAADAGTPSYAVLTGEPGIGKSRLAAELASVARARGIEILVGRCSQDDGAPPLWPWAQVLERLGLELPSGAEDEGSQFQSWETITRAVRDAARHRTLLVVLDDLHWADSSTLRVLRLLADTAEEERLLVVGTWRSHPEPTGPLADVAETLARSHARRIELTGLPSEAVAEVFETVAHNRPSTAQADALRERTDGNPFFLVEYARLAGERSDLARLVEDDPPTGVQDVLARRLGRLADDTVTALRTAAVIGRQFDLPTLAAATGTDEDDLLDLLEPAQAAGLVREDGVDRFMFSHALVRDTLAAGTRSSRRARLHARVAGVLAGVRGRETEVARHWLAAGSSYAGQAWRAAVVASEVARRLYAHDQSVELLGAALDAMELDPTATQRERYAVLMARIDAYRWAAQLPELVATVEQAIGVAEAAGDPELVATAAIATTQGALWRSAEPGHLNDLVVGALRTSLDRLPGADGALRCRVMLALANELEAGATFLERQALTDEAVAMARRLDDPALLLDACQVSFVALWVPQTAAERLALATEAMELSQRLGNEQAFVVSACLRTVVLGELGRPHEMDEAALVAGREAERLRIGYGELVLDSALIPWRAMAGRFEECDARLAHIHQVANRLSHSFAEEATAASLLSLRLWQGRALEVVPLLREMNSEPYVFSATITVFLWRGGDEATARAHHAEHGAPLEHHALTSLMAWCHAAEAALYLGEPALAARAYDLLTPFTGRSCSAGSSAAMGPVDAFVALAAAAAGEKTLAAQHAEDALALCDAWQVPLVAPWLRAQRDRFSF
jgi:DNA-binding SARP family transcriptional activator